MSTFACPRSVSKWSCCSLSHLVVSTHRILISSPNCSPPRKNVARFRISPFAELLIVVYPTLLPSFFLVSLNRPDNRALLSLKIIFYRGERKLSETKLGVRSTSDRREKKREWPREGLILQPGTMENKIEFAENGDQGGLPVPRCYSSTDTSQRRPGTPLFFSWIQFSSLSITVG